MQKLILDTNVIVSALISNLFPNKILYELVLKNKVKICLSDDIYTEYIDVLDRDKFRKFPAFKDKASVVLTKLKEIAIFYQPKIKIETLSDKSDNKFLELAVASSAN